MAWAWEVVRQDMPSSLPIDSPRPRLRLWDYGRSLGLVAAAALAGHQAQPQFADPSIALLFLLAVLLSALLFGAGPGLFAAGAAALAYNVGFLAPRGALTIGRVEDLLAFGVFFVVALSTGWLVGRVRQSSTETGQRAATIATLLDASRAMSAAATPDEAAGALAAQLEGVTRGAVVVLTPSPEGLRLAAAPRDLTSLSAEGQAAAEAAWEGGASDGEGWAFAPLDGVRGRVGVVGYRTPALTPEVREVAQGLARQGALALERAGLAQAAAENAALRRAQDLQTALLNSVSHDFRTPLATVLGSSTTLLEYEGALPAATQRDLLLSIVEEAQRLNRYVGDLLDMGRIDGGALAPRSEPTDARVVCEAALSRLDTRGRRIERRYSDRLSLVPVDPLLVEQAVLNVLENALAHTPPEGAITIGVEEDEASVLIAVDDEGPGIPAAHLADVFAPFRRLDTSARKSSGLGLSIAKGFVEAVGGRIAAVSPLGKTGGARLLISLPKGRPTPADLL